MHVLSQLLSLIPLGIVGSIRWTSWCIRRIAAMFYRPLVPGHREPMSIVTPVYQEDPDLFRLALESWLANPVEEVICVIDVTDVTSIRIATEYAEATSRVRVIETTVPGKRDALVRGWVAARTSLVALVDSDTIWDPAVGVWVMAPFADPAVGGVGTRQNAYQPQGLWSNFADLYLDYRYYDEIAAQSAVGQAVSCLSGRTAVYRRDLLLQVEAAFLSETFLGVPCMSGDDKRLTTLLLAAGHRTVLQREARVWSTFPNDFRTFLKQRIRWARNTWRSDLRALGSRWLWGHRFLTFTTIDKAMSSFTLLFAPAFLLWSLARGHWKTALILIAWWMISRAVKLLPHFSRRPVNLVRLPLFIGITVFQALVKIYALITIKQQKWLTRDVEVVDGHVTRTAEMAAVGSRPAAVSEASAA